MNSMVFFDIIEKKSKGKLEINFVRNFLLTIPIFLKNYHILDNL